MVKLLPVRPQLRSADGNQAQDRADKQHCSYKSSHGHGVIFFDDSSMEWIQRFNTTITKGVDLQIFFENPAEFLEVGCACRRMY